MIYVKIIIFLIYAIGVLKFTKDAINSDVAKNSIEKIIEENGMEIPKWLIYGSFIIASLFWPIIFIKKLISKK